MRGKVLERILQVGHSEVAVFFLSIVSAPPDSVASCASAKCQHFDTH
jgi:hypothetical protein